MNRFPALQRLLRRILLAILVGLVPAQAVKAMLLPGELIISEVMSNPSKVSDGNGEWFELYNPTARAIQLNGLLIRDNGSNQHTVSAAKTLLIQPDDVFVLGRNNDINSNGGYVADYRYSNFTLANTADEIIIEFNNSIIASLMYNSSLFTTAGNSVEYGPDGYTLTSAQNRLIAGDIGSPGSHNSIVNESSIAVPEPASSGLLTAGVAGLLLTRRFKTSTKTGFKTH